MIYICMIIYAYMCILIEEHYPTTGPSSVAPTGQDVNRWHEWLQKMLQVQGRLHVSWLQILWSARCNLGTWYLIR